MVTVNTAAPTIDEAPRAGAGGGHSPSTAHVRMRESADGLVASISFDAAGNNEVPLSVSAWDEAAKGSIGEALRNALLSYRTAPIEVDTVPTGDGAEQSGASNPVLEILQDPVRIASATFTAGFVWWLTRSGGLLTTLLLGVPAWRHVDLLPVLARSDDDDESDGHGSDEGDARAEEFDDSAVAELFGAHRPAGGRA